MAGTQAEHKSKLCPNLELPALCSDTGPPHRDLTARKRRHNVHPVAPLEGKHQQRGSGCRIPHGSSGQGCGPSKARGWELDGPCATETRRQRGEQTLSFQIGFGSSAEPHRAGQTLPSSHVHSLDPCQTFPVFLIITLTFLVRNYSLRPLVLRAARRSGADFQHRNGAGSRVHPAQAIPGSALPASSGEAPQQPQDQICSIALPFPLLLPIFLASGLCVE